MNPNIKPLPSFEYDDASYAKIARILEPRYKLLNNGDAKIIAVHMSKLRWRKPMELGTKIKNPIYNKYGRVAAFRVQFQTGGGMARPLHKVSDWFYLKEYPTAKLLDKYGYSCFAESLNKDLCLATNIIRSLKDYSERCI
ncbi:MAG: hypothetical protein LBH81_00730 [Rickettsiales bacterium]|jgi:hypothetical protein|nr:hypothetical protein [Rickettsiales bacterium]